MNPSARVLATLTFAVVIAFMVRVRVAHFPLFLAEAPSAPDSKRERTSIIGMPCRRRLSPRLDVPPPAVYPDSFPPAKF